MAFEFGNDSKDSEQYIIGYQISIFVSYYIISYFVVKGNLTLYPDPYLCYIIPL